LWRPFARGWPGLNEERRNKAGKAGERLGIVRGGG